MRKRTLLVLTFGVPALVLLLIPGCSEKSTWPAPQLVLESVPTTARPRIDGKALDREWFSAPELLVAMTDEQANGGGNFYIRVKSVYFIASPDTVFFMFQWADTTDDVLPDRLVYTGPEWNDMDCGADHALINPLNWTRLPGDADREDRLCIVFEITPVSDDLGSFAARGCQVACHGGMQVPVRATPNGKFDAWYWTRARSDPVLKCDDMVLDSTGFRGDEGDAIWRLNLRDLGSVPRFIAKGTNSGLSPNKFVFDPGPFGRTFNPCDTINPATGINWNDPRDQALDYVPGYLVKVPTGSRNDVTAKGDWEEGRWALEMKRAMNTEDFTDDVVFRVDRTYNFAIAIMNGSKVIHSGSVPLVLKFRR